MQINTVKLVYFSPTRTTAKILTAMAEGFRDVNIEVHDLTLPGGSIQRDDCRMDEAVILGAPVYGDRIPRQAAARLRTIRGNQTPAAVIAVYGNRAYGDALLELRELAVEQGFLPIAGGAFIGEHSYDSERTPIATGRPDALDTHKAQEFGAQIFEKLREFRLVGAADLITVPGNMPFHEWNPKSGIAPETIAPLCTLCGVCAEVCPTAAITVADTVITDRERCMLCSACVKQCPTGARVWEDEWINKAGVWLTTTCQERKEPEVFI